MRLTTLSMASPSPLLGDPCPAEAGPDGNCVIAEGDPDHRINGVPVAYAGTQDLLRCHADRHPPDLWQVG